MADSKPWETFNEHEEKRPALSVPNPCEGRPKLIFGGGPLGGQLKPKELAVVLNEWYKEVGDLHIDGAYLYGNEEFTDSNNKEIAEVLSKSRVSSKVCPMFYNNTKGHPFSVEPCPDRIFLGLSPESIRKQLMVSFGKLNRDSLDTMYLHYMDASANFNLEGTLKCIDELYQEGRFQRWGLSNFYSWQVAQIWQICKQKGYVPPAVYEGHYNPICRDVESELLPCLRYFGIDFVAYGVLANGVLSGNWQNVKWEQSDGIDGTHRMGLYFSKHIYWRKSYFEAFDVIKKAADELYGADKVDYAELAFRWMVHHSQLGARDSLVAGVSKQKYLKPTVDAVKKGAPLEEKMVAAFDAAWLVAKKETRGYVQWSTEYGIIRSDDPVSRRGLRASAN